LLGLSGYVIRWALRPGDLRSMSRSSTETKTQRASRSTHRRGYEDASHPAGAGAGVRSSGTEGAPGQARCQSPRRLDLLGHGRLDGAALQLAAQGVAAGRGSDRSPVRCHAVCAPAHGGESHGSAGVPVSTAAAALGHDPAIYLRTYAHLYPGDLRSAADAMDAVRTAARKGKDIAPADIMEVRGF
jgi:hypothetical protein